eukprot:6312666-Pyramimonas_sp.AAC.1
MMREASFAASRKGALDRLRKSLYVVFCRSRGRAIGRDGLARPARALECAGRGAREARLFTGAALVLQDNGPKDHAGTCPGVVQRLAATLSRVARSLGGRIASEYI